ncbi:MAG TPA: 4-(cytidine 5'-diphospho)-2-C-methyl-D-erythritol kinase [Longimicrobiales bacterium]
MSGPVGRPLSTAAGSTTPPTGAAAPDATAVRLAAPAKVNLRLRVLAREASGYHQLETLFCALTLADELAVERAGTGIRLEVEGAALGPPEANLAHRAARAFFDAARITPGVRIRLVKNVPAGAGLGGGSSDAAATLRALNALHGTPLAHEELLRLGTALGSDVPFFLCGSALALAWGRGERLLALPALPPAPVLIAMPPFEISTADAYRALDDSTQLGGGGGHGAHGPRAPACAEPAVLRPELFATWEAVAAAAVNDFERPTFQRFPELARAKDTLARAGAAPALLAGSGAALFGIFADARVRDGAAAALARLLPDLRLIRTATAGPAGASTAAALG